MDELTHEQASPPILEFENSVGQKLHAEGMTLTNAQSEGQCILTSVTSLPLARITTLLLDEAKRFGLIAIPQSSTKNLSVIVFDPTHASGFTRTWSLLAISMTKPIPDQQNFNPLVSAIFQLRFLTNRRPPLFFTILGPEGVGKTTLCNNLIKNFQRFPIRFRQFHHTAEWKGGHDADDAMTLASNLKQQTKHPPQREPSPTRMPTFLRRMLPENVLHNLSSFRAELIYMNRVRSYIRDGNEGRNLIISDRYCYDRLVRWTNLKKSPGQRLGASLVCHLMQRPTKAFVLRDNPENIHARKQAMSIHEIGLHQRMLVDACTKMKVPFEELWVTGKTAECVASIVTKRILEIASHRIFEFTKIGPQ